MLGAIAGDFVEAYHDYFHRYPDTGFGGGFMRWAATPIPRCVWRG